MKCQEIKEKMDPYLHGELEVSQRSGFEQHLAQCPLCRLVVEKEQGFEGLIRNYMHKEEAPFELREAVVQRLQDKRVLGWLGVTWLKAPSLRIASAGVFMSLLGGLIFTNLSRPFPLFAESVDSHVEYLKGSYPVEIVSSDREVVAAWFQGKVDFMVKIPDLSEQGFQLVGGRLFNLKDRKVAYVMFKKGERVLSAFIMDMRDIRIPKSRRVDGGGHIHYVSALRGYQSVLCLPKANQDTGCVYVSDMPQRDLLQVI